MAAASGSCLTLNSTGCAGGTFVSATDEDQLLDCARDLVQMIAREHRQVGLGTSANSVTRLSACRSRSVRSSTAVSACGSRPRLAREDHPVHWHRAGDL